MQLWVARCGKHQDHHHCRYRLRHRQHTTVAAPACKRFSPHPARRRILSSHQLAVIGQLGTSPCASLLFSSAAISRNRLVE
ncbi:hypothetical protein PoB_003816900 [Plakobranchus ocellatus]|uniref:Uncharacterized protein n=1 Tax=Plakobranchus ocellatus TaxID=259542 RepID=A0AAV4AZ61_9GAST|nr:hypothetical protein PoB_003816900 [Plakobranchus ocellatus]